MGTEGGGPCAAIGYVLPNDGVDGSSHPHEKVLCFFPVFCAKGAVPNDVWDVLNGVHTFGVAWTVGGDDISLIVLYASRMEPFMGAYGPRGERFPSPQFSIGEAGAEEGVDVVSQGRFGFVGDVVLFGVVRLMSALVISWSISSPTPARSLR